MTTPGSQERPTPRVGDILADVGLLADSQLAAEQPMRILSGPPPAPLTALGPYDILQRLGAGAMGTVYRARHRPLGREVALKVLDPLVAANSAGLERFRREARLQAGLDHPGIVKMLDVGSADGREYLAMELIEGGDLGGHMSRGPLELTAAVDLLAQIARAVGYVHRHGVLHRDLKPANVLMGNCSGGRALAPHVSDFGLARALESSTALTGTKQIVGTPQYLAPEHFAAHPGAPLGPPVDVFSLGVMFYEMITGRLPFDAPTLLEVMRRIVEDEPIPPRRLRPEIGPEVEAVCLMALRKDPRRRYPDADALAEDLERLRRLDPVQARPEPRGERWRRALKRHRLRAGLAAALLLALAGALGWAVHSERRARLQAQAMRTARIDGWLREAGTAVGRGERLRAYALCGRGLALDPARTDAAAGLKSAALGLVDAALALHALDEAAFILDELGRSLPGDAEVARRRDEVRSAVAAIPRRVEEAIAALRADAQRVDAAGRPRPLSESERQGHFGQLLSLAHPGLAADLRARAARETSAEVRRVLEEAAAWAGGTTGEDGHGQR